MNISSKEQVKILMVKEGLNARTLALRLQEYTGKNYTHQSILHKISLSSFRYDELKAIADMLGYEISIKKTNN